METTPDSWSSEVEEPDAPIHWDNIQANAWGSGWHAGWDAAMEWVKTHAPRS